VPRAERAQKFLIDPLAVTRDPARRAMSLEAQAAYDSLWLESWLEKEPGHLPADDVILARLAQCTDEQWQSVRGQVVTGFEVSRDTWICTAVERTKSKQDKTRTDWRKRKQEQRKRKRDIGVTSPTASPVSTVQCSTGAVQNRKEESKPSVADAPFVLPEWIPTDAWTLWENHRNAGPKTHRLTETSRRLCVKKLDGLRQDGFEPAAVIENSIANGYRGLFPPSTNGHSKPADTENDGWAVTYRPGSAK